MTLNKQIKISVECVLNEKIIETQSVSGGCINDAKIIVTEKNNRFFLKNNSNQFPDFFYKEANGLNEIEKSKTIRVPSVITVTDVYILLEYIASSSKSKQFWEDFGRRFAQMHKYSSNVFGFYEDNYIGSNPQFNNTAENEKQCWTEFYWNKRLLYQFHLAEKNGYSDYDLRNSFKLLESRIDKILNQENEKPSLLHGDLWSGNFIADDRGNACVIDPAVYYGNREADLAMTKLFGGFDEKFYKSYNEEYPFKDGYEYRENIYKLYHVLNHLNLFGVSYKSNAINLISYYF